MAIPKKGRLFEKCSKMLKGAGIDFHREPRLDVALCNGIPLTLVFLPAADIATYVGEGNVDIGITGFDVVQESNVTVNRILDLGFGKCKLCVQAPAEECEKDVSEFAGSRIVTSFPHLTKTFFDPFDKEKGVKTSIKFVRGSVEAACGLGLADAIVDLVETGTTMRAAGLDVVSDILETEAMLISSTHSEHEEIVTLIKKRIEGYIVATKHVMITYNVSDSLLSEAIKITPGKRSPTITGLDDGSGKSISALVKKADAADKMDKLHSIGATDILVFELSNTRF